VKEGDWSASNGRERVESTGQKRGKQAKANTPESLLSGVGKNQRSHHLARGKSRLLAWADQENGPGHLAAHPLPQAQVLRRSLERRGRCLGGVRGWGGRGAPSSIWAVVGCFWRRVSWQPERMQARTDVSTLSSRPSSKPTMRRPASRRHTRAALTARCPGLC
jgi:hypothetical protein